MTNPYTKAALLVIRLAACGLMIWGFMLYGPDLYLHMKHRPVSTLPVLAFKAVPALAGVVLFWKSRVMAVHLTKDLE